MNTKELMKNDPADAEFDAKFEAKAILKLREFAYTRAFYNTSDAAKALGEPKRDLERMRREGKGPECHRRGNTYFYRLSDLEEWLRNQCKMACLIADIFIEREDRLLEAAQ